MRSDFQSVAHQPIRDGVGIREARCQQQEVTGHHWIQRVRGNISRRIYSLRIKEALWETRMDGKMSPNSLYLCVSQLFSL